MDTTDLNPAPGARCYTREAAPGAPRPPHAAEARSPRSSGSRSGGSLPSPGGPRRRNPRDAFPAPLPLQSFGLARSHVRFSECPRHSCAGASAVPGLLVGLDAEPVHQLVETAEQLDDRHELKDPLVVQSQLLHRRSVDLQSVVAAVDRRHRHGDDLLGQPVELPGIDHHRLHLVPVRLQVGGVGRHHLVHVGNEVDPKGGLDLLVDVPDPTRALVFGNHLDRWHPWPLVLGGRSVGPDHCRPLADLFEVMQDSRVLLPDLLEAAHHPLGRELLGHALEHLLALAHGPLAQRRSEAAKCGQGRHEDRGADDGLLHLGPSSLDPLSTPWAWRPTDLAEGLASRLQAAKTIPTTLASSPPSSTRPTAISNAPATTRMIRSAGPSFFANIFVTSPLMGWSTRRTTWTWRARRPGSRLRASYARAG